MSGRSSDDCVVASRARLALATRSAGRGVVVGLLEHGLLVERVLELGLQPELGPGGLVGGDREARVGAHLVRLGRVVERVFDFLAGAGRGDGGLRRLVELDRLRLAVVGGVGRGEERAVAIGQRGVADQRGCAARVPRGLDVDGHLAILQLDNVGNVALGRARTSTASRGRGRHRNGWLVGWLVVGLEMSRLGAHARALPTGRLGGWAVGRFLRT